MTEKIIEAVNVVKTYSVGGMPLHAVDHLNFDISAGEFAVILGPSGAGKTTLLNLIGGMDTITDGDLMVNGVNLRTLGRRQLTDYRRHDVGFVFQFYNLMPNLSALENIELAIELCKNAFSPQEMLEKVGLGSYAQFPRATFRRRTATRIHRAGSGKKSANPSVRRTDGRSRLSDRQKRLESIADYVPQREKDGHCRNA